MNSCVCVSMSERVEGFLKEIVCVGWSVAGDNGSFWREVGYNIITCGVKLVVFVT